MVDEFDDFKREISFFIASLHHSIHQHYSKTHKSFIEKSQANVALSAANELRSSFDFLIANNKNVSVDDFEAFRTFFIRRLRDLTASEQPYSGMKDITLSSSKRKNSFFKTENIFHLQREDRYDNYITISSAIGIVINYLINIDSNNFPLQRSLFSYDLERIVPPQQIAPVQFGIKAGKIVVSNPESAPDEGDREIVNNALGYISQAGEDIVKSLNNSNCDRRLIEIVRDLHSEIVSNGNIIKIGLMNMACSAVGVEFREELPTAISGMLTSYNSIISMYVSQFPDWKKFSKNASSTLLERKDIEELSICAERLIDTIQQNPAISDPEVPKTISFVRQLLSFPGPTSEKAAFAMIRTVENLVSTILRHGLNFFRKTADHVVEDGSKLTSKVIVALLGLALVGASGAGPAAMRSGIPWLTQVAEIVQKHIQRPQD